MKTHWEPRTSTSAFNWLFLKINYDLAYDYGNACSYVPCVILQEEHKLQAKAPSWTSVKFQAGSRAANWIWRTPQSSAASAPIPSAAQTHRARNEVSKHVSYILEEDWAISKNSGGNLWAILKHSAWAFRGRQFLLLTSFNLPVCKIEKFNSEPERSLLWFYNFIFLRCKKNLKDLYASLLFSTQRHHTLLENRAIQSSQKHLCKILIKLR